MGLVQTILCCEMGLDIDRRATETCFQPSAKRNLLCLRHTELATFPAVKGQRTRTILQVGFMLAPDSLVVQVEKYCNPGTAFPIVELQ